MPPAFEVKRAVLGDALFFEDRLSPADKAFLNRVYHYPNYLRLVECGAAPFAVLAPPAPDAPAPADPAERLRGMAVFDVEPASQSAQGEDVFARVAAAFPGLTPHNSLLLALIFVVDGSEEDYLSVFEALARALAASSPQLTHLVLSLEESDDAFAEREGFLAFLKNKRVWEARGDFLVFALSKITPKLFFRRAREEDQDNLSAISSAQTDLLAEQYGKFFLAEIISSEDDHKICLVAETEDKKAVGLAVVSSDLNFDVIAQNYDLRDFNYFTKSDYFACFEHRRSQIAQISQVQRQLLRARAARELEYHKIACSKNWLTLEMQEFCAANKSAFLSEFQQILADPDKHKLINKNIMKRKLDKLLKGHAVTKPSDVWARELDAEVATCVMTSSDLLLETLRHFELPANYMEGEGHWSFWVKRKQEERNEEAKQKGIMGKKKNKAKKKKAEDGKDAQLVTPPHFDVEPFYVALQHYINANLQIRQLICQALEALRPKVSRMFYLENGELQTARAVDLAEILEMIAAEEPPDLPENVQQLVPFVLVCFGNLAFDVERVVVSETAKTKSGKTKEKTNEKVLRKVALGEFFDAVQRIAKIDQLFLKKTGYLKELEAEASEALNRRAREIIEATHRDFETSRFFPTLQVLELNTPIEPSSCIHDVPREMRNAVCCSIFFIDGAYEQCSDQFLQSVFEFYEQFDYLVFTLPHKTPEFKLLQGFSKARGVKNSNFPHNLFVFYKANLLNKFAAVELTASRAQNVVCSAGLATDSARVVYFDFSVGLRVPGFPQSAIGRMTARKSVTIDRLKDNFDISDFAFLEAYGKNEVLEIVDFELHFAFQRLIGFALREALRLTKSRLMIRETGNPKLAPLASYFNFARPFGIGKLILGRKESHFGPNMIENRHLADFGGLGGQALSDVRPGPSSLAVPSSLSITSVKMLCNEREKMTARIVVIGASSCSVSFLEEILNHPLYSFQSVYLISESIDWEPQVLQTKPLKLERFGAKISQELLLERVSVIVGQVHYLDRKIKVVSVRTCGGREFQLEYDYLVFGNGLEEKTFEIFCDKKNSDEKLRKPKQIIAVDKLNASFCEAICSDQNMSLFAYLRHADGRGADDPAGGAGAREYNDLKPVIKDDEKILEAFKERLHSFPKICANKTPHPLILYGASIEVLVVLQQLVERWGVRPENLFLIIPRNLDLLDKEGQEGAAAANESQLEFIEKLIETPVAITNKRVRDFYFGVLAAEGVGIYQNYEITDISFSENTVMLKNLNSTKVEAKALKDPKGGRGQHPRAEGGTSGLHRGASGVQGEKSTLHNESVANSEETEEAVDYSLLVTGDIFDISYQIFRTIQDNGLVYNGRLIVQSNYQTIDEAIFGAGRICEFSQRYKSLGMGKSLRMDKYNQEEVGRSMARSFVAKVAGQPQKDTLESFQEPIGMSARLFPGFYVLELEFPYQGKLELGAALAFEVNDLLEAEGRGEFTSLGFDANGILKRVFYFGRRELNLEVARNVMGLHRSYFNNLFEHQRRGLVTSFVDYLNEGWAKVLLHPLFPKFKAILGRVCRQPGDEGAPREEGAGDAGRRLIEENVMAFIADHREFSDFYQVPDFKKRFAT